MTCSGAKASGIYGRIIWIDNFLQNRKIQVKVNGTLSDPGDLQNGVPQGSVVLALSYSILLLMTYQIILLILKSPNTQMILPSGNHIEILNF